MNKSETMKVLAILEVAYPQHFKSLSETQKINLGTLWGMMFKNDIYQNVMGSVEIYISNDTKGFFPIIGAIKEQMYNLNNPDQPTELEAWNTVKKVLGKAYYQTIECWDKLSPLVQRAVGSPSELKVWSNENIDTLNSVIASNFQRSYRAIAQTQKENTKINNLQLGNKKLKEIE